MVYVRPSLSQKISSKVAAEIICNLTCTASVREVMCSNLAKDVKIFTTLLAWVGWMPWLKIGATDYHTQLGLPEIIIPETDLRVS